MPKIRQLSQKEVKQVEKHLPNGWLNRASLLLNDQYSKPFISQVKNGQRANSDVVDVLLQLCQEEKKRKKEQESQIRESIN